MKTCCECGCAINEHDKVKLWHGKLLDICYDCWLELMKGR